jgi:hypothetical protein
MYTSQKMNALATTLTPMIAAMTEAGVRWMVGCGRVVGMGKSVRVLG